MTLFLLDQYLGDNAYTYKTYTTIYPSLFFNYDLNHIDLEQDVKIQFQIMYEMIKKELENSNLKSDKKKLTKLKKRDTIGKISFAVLTSLVGLWHGST